MVIFPKPKWTVCELFGIPVMIDITFALLLLMFLQSGSSFAEGMSSALILAISIVAHEFGHALTGRVFGCETQSITLSFIGGCASMVSMPRKGWQEFLVALAGPLVSFALALCSFLVFWMVPVENGFVVDSLWYLMWLNFILGCFNLLPGFPMDGGRIFRSVMMLFMSRPKATFVAMWIGRVFAILLGLSGLYALFHKESWAVVRIFIAWMIWQDGYREYQLALMESNWRYQDFRAHVSPPPYGGEGDDCDVTKDS